MRASHGPEGGDTRSEAPVSMAVRACEVAVFQKRMWRSAVPAAHSDSNHIRVAKKGQPALEVFINISRASPI